MPLNAQYIEGVMKCVLSVLFVAFHPKLYNKFILVEIITNRSYDIFSIQSLNRFQKAILGKLFFYSNLNRNLNLRRNNNLIFLLLYWN